MNTLAVLGLAALVLYMIGVLVRIQVTTRIRLYHIDRFYDLRGRYTIAFFDNLRGRGSAPPPEYKHYNMDHYVMGYNEICLDWRIWKPAHALRADYEQQILADLLAL